METADYDVRHYFSANFVLTDMFRHAGFHWGPNQVFGGWTLSSNWFLRSGLPFTVIDNSALAPLLGLNYSGRIFASPVANVSTTCNNAVNLSLPQLLPQFAPAANGRPDRLWNHGTQFHLRPAFLRRGSWR